MPLHHMHQHCVRYFSNSEGQRPDNYRMQFMLIFSITVALQFLTIPHSICSILPHCPQVSNRSTPHLRLVADNTTYLIRRWEPCSLSSLHLLYFSHTGCIFSQPLLLTDRNLVSPLYGNCSSKDPDNLVAKSNHISVFIILSLQQWFSALLQYSTKKILTPRPHPQTAVELVLGWQRAGSLGKVPQVIVMCSQHQEPQLYTDSIPQLTPCAWNCQSLWHHTRRAFLFLLLLLFSIFFWGLFLWTLCSANC